MSIVTYQITSLENIKFQTSAKTLDDITRELPQGFYSTFNTLDYGTRVLGLSTHLQRLYHPALELGLNPSVNEPSLRTRISGLAKINLPKESRIRLILTRNNGAIYIGIQPFEPLSKGIYEQGVKVVSSQITRQSPRLKDTGFISSSIEQRRQIGTDVFEILLTKRGKILEGMTSNFYALKGKTLLTARRGILLGVTRRVILRLARELGLFIEYRSPKLSEKFDETFLTSSSRGVVPIVSIDNKSVGQGRVGQLTKLISLTYSAFVLANAERI